MLPMNQDIYDAFHKEISTAKSDTETAVVYRLPTTWVRSSENKIQFMVQKTTEEYQSISAHFQSSTKSNGKELIRIELVQNEQWYVKYRAHFQDFATRLKQNTERHLHHGCAQKAADAIIKNCFDRDFAGKNGTVYGEGIYFSSNASYSHKYVSTNFIGKTTKGNSSMNTALVEFDSTTDENYIFLTYHDAQAYGEYLITYIQLAKK
ncbi:unnamed protein product [Rotaria magnacalcarata]|uniref:Poly [ADP-ribose] polymerase n=1 Tax=Rotaria magnacalcarata TaxID=392030 RepID=A0A8S2PZS2_9BILA|nr:unnamed protein product [Rotaria magnacalcarata]